MISAQLVPSVPLEARAATTAPNAKLGSTTTIAMRRRLACSAFLGSSVRVLGRVNVRRVLQG
jgi:hypothetical protein